MAVIRQDMLQSGATLIHEALEQVQSQEPDWIDISNDLVMAGLANEEIASLFRERGVWPTEARRMKAEGYPYDEIVFRLVTLSASWGEVGRAFLEAGLSPADMLRVVLPFVDGRDLWSLLQAAFLEGPEDADYREVRGVLDFFLISEEEILAALGVNYAQRERVAQRLGMQD